MRIEKPIFPQHSIRCLICDRIGAIRNGTNPYFVAETKTSYVVIEDHQFFEGYTILLHKEHKHELHQLSKSARNEFLCDMADVASAVYNAFSPRKLNYELLGNTDAHMHWHLVPRYADDPRPGSPIWTIDPSLRQSSLPNVAELDAIKERLIEQLWKQMSKQTLLKVA